MIHLPLTFSFKFNVSVKKIQYENLESFKQNVIPYYLTLLVKQQHKLKV